MAKVKQNAPVRPDEPLSFDQLNAWQAGRWRAGAHEAAEEVTRRARALAQFEQPGSDVIRDEDTGLLEVVAGAAPKPPTIEELRARYEDAFLELEEARAAYVAAGGTADLDAPKK